MTPREIREKLEQIADAKVTYVPDMPIEQSNVRFSKRLKKAVEITIGLRNAKDWHILAVLGHEVGHICTTKTYEHGKRAESVPECEFRASAWAVTQLALWGCPNMDDVIKALNTYLNHYNLGYVNEAYSFSLEGVLC